jgi:hypothetical protein
MPTSDNTINLIRTKTSNSPQLEAIERSLRKSAVIGLVSCICIAVLCGSVLTLLQMQLTGQEVEQSQLLNEINSLKTKEGYILAIKERTQTVAKAMTGQKPWAKMLDLVYTFAKPPGLLGIAVDEQDKIVLHIQTTSLEEILGITELIIRHVNTGNIKNPQLLSFQFGKNGTFDISISFFALFDTI